MKKILFSLLSTCSLYATTSYYYDSGSKTLTTSTGTGFYKIYDEKGVQYKFQNASLAGNTTPVLTNNGNTYLKAFKSDLFVVDYYTSPSNYAKLLHFVHTANDTDGFVLDTEFKVLSPGLTTQWADNNLTSYAVNLGLTEGIWQNEADDVHVTNTYLKKENGKNVLALLATDTSGDVNVTETIPKIEYTEGTKVPTIKTLAASTSFVNEYLIESYGSDAPVVAYTADLGTALHAPFANDIQTNWVIFGKNGLCNIDGETLSFFDTDADTATSADKLGQTAAFDAATKFAVITTKYNDQIVDKLLPVLSGNLNPSAPTKDVPAAFLKDFKNSKIGELLTANPVTFPIGHYITDNNANGTATSNTALTDAEDVPEYSTYTVPYSKGGYPGTTIPIELFNLNKFYIYATGGMDLKTATFPFKIAKNYDGSEVVKTGRLKVTFSTQ